ncbi:MAG: RNA polymerase sigma factor [Candidatus Neomarinimicrobiota bacterium]
METNLSEEELLVARAKQGDRAALSQLVVNYSSRIYHLGLRLSGNSQDAEDILQETFLIMLKKIGQFQGKSSFYTWIYRVAVNVGLRKLKSKPHKYDHISIDDPDFERVSTDAVREWPKFDFDVINDRRFRQKLDHLIEQLPEIYRTVFILRDLHELSTEDTSRILQITPSNAKIRLMRARNFLKERLESTVKAEAML